MVIKVIIIDDESLARKRVINLLNDIKEVKVIGECGSGKEAIKMIKTKKPDLIYLDIQMKDMTGFEVLQKLDPTERPQIIFITAYDGFALKAFDFFAFDYLLKPFKDERFYKSTSKLITSALSNRPSGLNHKINDLIDYIESPERRLSEFKNNKLPIKSSGRISFIEKSDIKYIQASGYYVEIFTDKKKYLLRESLTSLIAQLETNNFYRIHRSTIINISLIKEVIYSNYGEVDVKMDDEKLFRISKTYKKEFQQRIGI
ncbi:LytR/AlgR family response regulator transcription factor [Psychroserpens sp. MEBiC05023]